MIRRATWIQLLMPLLGAILGAPAFAAAPPGRYSVAEGTVRDERTGLVWQQGVVLGSYSQAEAAAGCTRLTLGAYSSGWRLPTRAELLSIVDPTESNPAIDRTAFPSTPTNYFWSVSPQAGTPSSAWAVNFLDGVSDPQPTTAMYRVRCVH